MSERPTIQLGHLDFMKGIGVGGNSNCLECKIINQMFFICLAGLTLIRHSPREAGISTAYLLRRSPQTRPTVKSLQTFLKQLEVPLKSTLSKKQERGWRLWLTRPTFRTRIRAACRVLRAFTPTPLGEADRSRYLWYTLTLAARLPVQNAAAP